MTRKFALKPDGATEGQIVELSRAEFNDLVELIRGALSITAVRMGDGRPTDRMCTACEMFPMSVHQPGAATCDCVCHIMREKLAKFDSM